MRGKDSENQIHIGEGDIELICPDDTVWLVIQHCCYSDPQGRFNIKYLNTNGLVTDLPKTLNRKYMKKSGYSFRLNGNVLQVIDPLGNPMFTCLIDGVSHEEVQQWYDSIERPHWKFFCAVFSPQVQAFSNEAIKTIEDSRGMIKAFG